MAPEVILRSNYNTKADIWSLGITAWELVHGLPPRAKIHPMKVLFMIPRDEPPKLPTTFSPEFCDFFSQCTEKKQYLRQSAESMLSHPYIANSGSVLDLLSFLENSSRAGLEGHISVPNTIKMYAICVM
jgi:serine/threonine-protein kinase 24/25/MST4